MQPTVASDTKFKRLFLDAFDWFFFDSICLFQSGPGTVIFKLRPAKEEKKAEQTMMTSANESGRNKCVGGCLICVGQNKLIMVDGGA